MTTITTLNITTNSIKYLAAKGDTITHWGTLPSKDILKNGLLQQPAAAGIQIKSLFESERLPDKKVVCSINGLPFSYRILTLPKLDTAAQDEAISRAARREMPASLEDTQLTWHGYPVENNEWEVLVSGVTERPLASLVATLRYAGIRPYRLSLPHISLSRLVGRKDCIILDFEPDCSTLVLVTSGIPRAVHTTPPPGIDVTPEDRAGQFTHTIVKMVDYYNNSHPNDPVDETIKVVLTGEMADSETADYLTGRGMPFLLELLTPEIEVIPGLSVNTYAVNIGSIMLHGGHDKDTAGRTVPHRDINLRKIDAIADGFDRFKKIAGKTLLPVSILLAVVSLIIGLRSQAQADADIRQLQMELDNALSWQTAMVESIDYASQLQDTIDELADDLSAIEYKSQYFTNAVKYVSNLGLMMFSMPDNLSFSSIELRENGMTIYGYASNPHNIVKFAENLESSGRFSEANIMWINTNNGKPTADGSTNNKFLLVINK